jgi:hypothetical protein
VPAGEQPGVRAVLGEQRQRLLDACRALVAKRCWDLQDSSSGLSSFWKIGVGMVALSTTVK